MGERLSSAWSRGRRSRTGGAGTRAGTRAGRGRGRGREKGSGSSLTRSGSGAGLGSELRLWRCGYSPTLVFAKASTRTGGRVDVGGGHDLAALLERDLERNVDDGRGLLLELAGVGATEPVDFALSFLGMGKRATWIFMWVLRFPLSEKALSHPSNWHLYGRSPVCRRLCIFRVLARMNEAWQVVQINGLWCWGL
jgi:hypothetical protein